MNKVYNHVVSFSASFNEAGDNGKKPSTNLMKITVAVAFAALGIAGIATGYLPIGISALALTLGLGYCLCKAAQYVFAQYQKYKAQQNAPVEPNQTQKIEPKLPPQIEPSKEEIKFQKALEVVRNGTEEEIIGHIISDPSLINLRGLYDEDSEIYQHAKKPENQTLLIELEKRSDLDRTALGKAKLVTLCLKKPIKGMENKHKELTQKFIRQSGIDKILFQGKQVHEFANSVGNGDVGTWILDYYEYLRPKNENIYLVG
jgi:hypothetical protein